MKKTVRKLVLRKEILRELSGEALSRVIGGHETDAAYPQTGPKQCLNDIVALDRVGRDND